MQLLPEPFVEISEDDARESGIVDGEKVVVKGNGYEAAMKLRIAKGSQKGVAFVPENFDSVSVNMFYKKGEGIPRVKIVKLP